MTFETTTERVIYMADHVCDSNVSWADENYRYTECSKCGAVQDKTPR